MSSRTFLDGRVTLHCGDALATLAAMEPDSVDCVVTSPPYWGLRDYGTASWQGGDPECDHRSPTMRDGRNEERAKLAGLAATNRDQLLLAHRSACGKCGAVKVDHQLGLEPTLAEHLTAMVTVFEEVRRVLKPSGTLWINYGDCYATSPNGRSAADTKATGNDDRTFRDKPFSTIGGVLKPKDLCMVPNRLAIALQEAGWWVRSEIVWGKPNPMPESIKDRPATAHEKIFMLTKSARYYYDAAAVRQGRTSDVDASGFRGGSYVGGVPGRRTSIGNVKIRGLTPRHSHENNHTALDTVLRGFGRNLRNYEPAPLDAWRIATRPFPDAHFATFPPELAERCILAGCPKGGVVLDPFAGAGTTGLVALRSGRLASLIELSPTYCDMIERRLTHDWMGPEERAAARTPQQPIDDFGLFATRDAAE